ncbi:MAG: hypothetical protein ACP5H2_05485 [Solirubrobacteraceae bacterium]
MPSSHSNIAMARAVGKLPLLRKVPLARLVLLAELGMLAKQHFERLSPAERRRLVLLLRDAKGWPSNLNARQRREFESLVAKLDPKLFARTALERFSPFPTRRRSGE